MEWSWEPPNPKPIGSMYGIFTYIWLIFMVNPMGNGKDGEFFVFFLCRGGWNRRGPKKWS